MLGGRAFTRALPAVTAGPSSRRGVGASFPSSQHLRVPFSPAVAPRLGSSSVHHGLRLKNTTRAAAKKQPEEKFVVADEEDYEEEEGDEIEIMSLPLSITIDKLPKGVITTKQVTDLVMDIIKKSAVGVPTEEMLEEMGIEEDPILVVAPEDPEVGFNVEEDSLFAEILFLEEEAANGSMPVVIAALEKEGFSAAVADFTDDEVDEDDDDK